MEIQQTLVPPQEGERTPSNPESLAFDDDDLCLFSNKVTSTASPGLGVIHSSVFPLAIVWATNV